MWQINPFVPNAPFFYPLKTSENRKVFLYFQEIEKGCIVNKLVNKSSPKFKKLQTQLCSEKKDILRFVLATHRYNFL